MGAVLEAGPPTTAVLPTPQPSATIQSSFWVPPLAEAGNRFLTINCAEASPEQTPQQGLMEAKVFPLVLK